jgi:hypothetical protein
MNTDSKLCLRSHVASQSLRLFSSTMERLPYCCGHGRARTSLVLLRSLLDTPPNERADTCCGCDGPPTHPCDCYGQHCGFCNGTPMPADASCAGVRTAVMDKTASDVLSRSGPTAERKPKTSLSRQSRHRISQEILLNDGDQLHFVNEHSRKGYLSLSIPTCASKS